MNIFLIVLSSLLLTFSLLSVIRHDYWTFRVFDYPRLQKFVATILTLILVTVFYNGATIQYILMALLSINLIFLAYQIIPFTPLSKKHILQITKQIPDQSISIIIANVYQENTNYKSCIDELSKNQADIILLLETNKMWEQQTLSLEKTHPFHKRLPLENTYGMLLYSRYELIDTEIKFLVEKDIPSIHTKIKLPSGQLLQLYALHPTPPVPNENPRSTERDKELLLVADLAKASKDPVIVIGDMNDVAWSYTTELFLKMSGLLDPRRGRGFYNSFHAHYPIMRFPLDHAFISTDFKLNSMKRLNNFDSDHFPIYIALQYEPTAKHQQESMEVTAEDKEIALEKKQADT
ncbi:endonuclease/exonuclease/phosphatase family protein [Pedobacter sp. ASV1-7]|uniref:endonuclease/exonuclease/phosphatase family protein n=1 Tax=Pedobacter sp. ASV1-7 TaxID=3145237 RepID=UPI0032E859AC